MKLKLSKQGTYADIARANKDIFCMDLKSQLRFLTDGKAKTSTSTPGSSKAASVPFQGKVCHDKRPIEQFPRANAIFEEQIISKNKYASIFVKSNAVIVSLLCYYPSNTFRNFKLGNITQILPVPSISRGTLGLSTLLVRTLRLIMDHVGKLQREIAC